MGNPNDDDAPDAPDGARYAEPLRYDALKLAIRYLAATSDQRGKYVTTSPLTAISVASAFEAYLSGPGPQADGEPRAPIRVYADGEIETGREPTSYDSDSGED